MILFADSGSTKSDWLLVEDDRRIYTSTIGFNPFFHDSAFIERELSKNEILEEHKDQITAIYYYGAGCSSLERNRVVKRALSALYKNVERWVIEQDMAAAAYATCKDQAGIVCILGTGSNSCLYTGREIRETVPALGYILGDEGSGAYFGKKFVAEYMYDKLPADLTTCIDNSKMSKEEILKKVYNEPHANVFLASFIKILSPCEQTAYFRKVIYEGLRHFAQEHIVCFDHYKTQTVHFVGSIAYHYQDLLHELSTELEFKIGKIIKKPIDGLANFHLEQHKTSDAIS